MKNKVNICKVDNLDSNDTRTQTDSRRTRRGCPCRCRQTRIENWDHSSGTSEHATTVFKRRAVQRKHKGRIAKLIRAHADLGIQNFCAGRDLLCNGRQHFLRPITEEMRQANIRCRKQQRGRSHAFQRHHPGFVMNNFRPLFNQIAFAVGTKVQRDFQRISRVVQLDLGQFAAGIVVRSCDAFKNQRRRSVAVSVDDLQAGSQT